MRLHTQIILLIGAVAMGIGLISSILVSRMLHSTLETELRDQAVVATQSLAEHITDNVINGEVIEAREALRNMVERSQSIQYAYIIDFDGRLFAHSFEGGFPKALAAAPRQYYAASAQSPKMIHLKTNTGFVLEIGYPLIESMRAHVRIGMNEAHTQAQIASLRNRIIGLSLLLALISITIGVFVSRRMTQPLAEMVGFMRDFGMRKREEKIDFRGGGREMAALARAFNWMISERKRAEEALKESEEKHRLIFETAANLIISVDSDGTLMDCNNRIEEVLGYKREEMIGQNMGKIIHPDYHPKAQESLAELMTTGTAYNKEYKMVCKDGRLIDVSVNSSAITDEQGNFIRSICIIDDITERKQARVFMQTVIDGIPDSMIVINRDYTIALANQTAYKTAGGQDPVVAGMKCHEISHNSATPCTDTEDICPLEQVIASKAPVTVEHIHYDAKGHTTTVEITAAPIFDKEGEVIQIIESCRDITERKQAERALKESEEKFRKILASSPDAIMLFDAESRQFLEVNEAAVQLYGYSREEFLKLKQPQITDEIEASDSSIKDLLSGKLSKILLHYHKKKDGTVFPAEISGSTFSFKDRKVMCGIIRDITERKRAEYALKESEERFKGIYSQSPVGIEIYDLDGKLIDVNQVCLDMFGVESVEEVKGFRLFEDPNLPDSEKELLKKGEEVQYESEFNFELVKEKSLYKTSKSGRMFIDCLITPVKAYDGSPNGYLVHVRDITERKRAERAIKESEAQFRFLFENSLVGVGIADASGKVLFCNETMERILGLSKEELSRLNVADTYKNPEDQKRLLEILRRDGQVLNYEVELIRKTNKPFWVSLSTKAVKFRGGEARLTTCIDITERKQAETALHKHVLEQNILLKVSQSVSGTLDLEVVLQTIGDGVTQMLDIETAAIYLLEEENLFLGATTPPLDPQMPEALRRAQLADHPHLLESVFTGLPVILPDIKLAKLSPAEKDIVEIRKLRSLLFLPFKQEENVIGVLILGTISQPREFSDHEIDLCQTITNQLALGVQNARLHTGLKKYTKELEDQITERKQAEENLRESEKKFKRITERIYDVIVAANLEGDITYVSPSVIRVFGHSPEELVGKNIIEFVPKAEISHVLETFKFNTAGEEVEGHHSEFLMKDGSFARIELNAVPIIEDGKIVGAQAIIRNVTETKRLQELESRAERLETAGTIAGQVAHDFNNLLAPIMAYPEFIHDELPHDNQAHAFLDAIESAAKKIADINQDLLTMGRRGHYSLEVINLNRIVLQAVLGMESRSDTVIYNTDLCEDLMSIKGGDAQIHRMLLNLLVNAQDAMEDMGQITIKTENYYADDTSVAFGRVPRGEYVKLTVSDNGCGIPDDIIEKILDPFFTTKTADRKRGSGLGLSVVDAVVKDHNGYLDLRSKVGHGTSFYLYFPVTREDSGIDESEHLAGGTEKVLVVDDDETQREVVLKLLKKLGYRVSSVESGERAIEFLVENPQDLVVLDMIMPGGIDGTETYRQILDINPHQKAIILSGLSESDRVLEAQMLGAGAFVRKPVTKSVIAAAVRTELDRQVDVVTT